MGAHEQTDFQHGIQFRESEDIPDVCFCVRNLKVDSILASPFVKKYEKSQSVSVDGIDFSQIKHDWLLALTRHDGV